jgi:hypothetical protein
MKTINYYSKTILWIGIIIKILCILFLLMDALMKIIKSAPTIRGSIQLGYPENDIQGTGIVLFLITILYVIPKSSILGAIVITGYLGGAVAIMLRANIAGHSYLFPVVFGIIIWIPVFLAELRIRQLIPFKRKD